MAPARVVRNGNAGTAPRWRGASALRTGRSSWPHGSDRIAVASSGGGEAIARLCESPAALYLG